MKMDTLLQQELRNAGYEGAFDLASLVEACGDDFDSLYQNAPSHWQAVANYGDGNEVSCDGSTPTEAVANLWIELNPLK